MRICEGGVVCVRLAAVELGWILLVRRGDWAVCTGEVVLSGAV